MTKAARDAILARADAATKGPWVENSAYESMVSATELWTDEQGEARDEPLIVDLDRRGPDREFVRHARADIPALLEDLDAQDAEIARLTAENDRLIATVRADEWQARYWAEHDAVADREATIMAERANAAAVRRALERIQQLAHETDDDVIEQIAHVALQSGAGKALLDAHAAELAAEKKRADGHFESYKRIKGKLSAKYDECEALRQRVETADAMLRETQNAVRNQRGDDLCWIQNPENAEFARALPESEFLESCRRFHAQIVSERGEFAGGKTIAQLEAQAERLRASQAADLTRIEESYNRLIRELEEGKRKAEAERNEAKRDTARLDWLLEKRHRHNSQIRIEVGEPSIWEEFPTPREAIDVAMQSDAPEDQ